MTRQQFSFIVKPLVFIACLSPLALLIAGLLQDSLGANPIEELTRRSGEWALRFLLFTLSMTPIQRLFKQAWPIKLRRMLGLYTFFYACVHLLTYIWLDQFFDWGEIFTDILKRPFILVGMLAFLLLVPLAATSTHAMIRRLGRLWKRLHQLVYVISGLGVLHFFMLVKKDLFTPSIYLVILMILLGIRLANYWRRQLKREIRTTSAMSS